MINRSEPNPGLFAEFLHYPRREIARKRGVRQEIDEALKLFFLLDPGSEARVGGEQLLKLLSFLRAQFSP
jgi:hypothetical protein